MQGFHCVLVGQPESVMSCIVCLLCGPREPYWSNAVLCQNLIKTVACLVESAVTEGVARTTSKRLNTKG